MKFALFISLCALAVYVSAQAPPIPQLPQAFKTNYTLNFPGWNRNQKDQFIGFLELDADNGGGRAHIQGEEVLPLYFETSAIAHPVLTNESVTAYLWYEPTCWVSNAHVDFLKVWPLKIPADAQWGGNSKYQGIDVQTWQWTSEDDVQWNMAVDAKEPHAIRQVNVSNSDSLFGLIVAQFDMTNVVVGPVNPNEFKHPTNVKCVWQGNDDVQHRARAQVPTKASKPSWNGPLGNFVPRAVQTSLMHMMAMQSKQEKRAVPARVPKSFSRTHVHEAGAPQPPKLAQAFTADYKVIGSYSGTTIQNQQILNGDVAIDYTNGGGTLTINSTATPVLLATSLTAHPHGELVTGYWFEGDICLSTGVPKSFLEIFPLAIPQGAQYEGKKMINGAQAEGWKFDAYYDSGITYWVRVADSCLVQIDLADADYSDGAGAVLMTNVKVGVDKSKYAPPQGVVCRMVF